MSYRALVDRPCAVTGGVRASHPGHPVHASVDVGWIHPDRRVERRAYLVGEIDQSCADVVTAGFAQLVDDEDGGPILVDCEDLGFIDLAGLRVLLAVARDCDRRERPFRIVNLPPYFARLVRRLRLETQLHVEDDGSDPDQTD